MRALRIIAAIAIVALGVGVKLIFISARIIEAEARSLGSASMDVSQMHKDIRSVPMQKFQDMSVVFLGDN
jgi:hypothetical protein